MCIDEFFAVVCRDTLVGASISARSLTARACQACPILRDYRLTGQYDIELARNPLADLMSAMRRHFPAAKCRRPLIQSWQVDKRHTALRSGSILGAFETAQLRHEGTARRVRTRSIAAQA